MKVAILVIALFFLVVPAVVLARSENDEEKQERKLERKIEIDEEKLVRDSLKSERKASLSALKVQVKENLAKIRDEKKKEILEKLGEKIIKVNSNRVDHFEKIIAKLEEILARIETKSGDLKAAGKNTTELDAAITQASTDLEAASLAVETQSGKEYTLNIASPSGLKNEAGKFISGMQSDLRVTAEAVNKAKKSVHTALMVLKRTFGGALPKTATPSGTPILTPTQTPSPSGASTVVPTL